jgi:hypothetical protein
MQLKNPQNLVNLLENGTRKGYLFIKKPCKTEIRKA